MAIQFASGALKSRDTPQSQWEDAIVAVRVNDVAVQDTTPTGTEHIWVDTDDPGEVVVPTIEDHNVLANAIGIVVDGNKSALGAAEGQYVILQNSTITGKDDGLYTAVQTIPADTVIDGTYLTAVSGGGLNDLLSSLKLPYNGNISVPTVKSPSDNTTYICRYGKLAILNVFVKYASATTSADDLYTLPLRPVQDGFGALIDVTNTKPVLCKVYTSGNVRFISSVPANSYVEGSVVYLTND